MKTVFYKDKNFDLLTNKHKWALSTETMDEEIWFGDTVQQAWDNLCLDKYNRLIPAKFIEFDEVLDMPNSETKKVDKPTSINVLKNICNQCDTFLVQDNTHKYTQIELSTFQKISDLASSLWNKIKSQPSLPLTQKECEKYHIFSEKLQFLFSSTSWSSKQAKNDVALWIWEINQVLEGKTQDEIDQNYLKKNNPIQR